MKENHPLTKLLAFKLIVGLVILEKILFLILQGVNALQVNDTLTYVDVLIGLPEMVICVQMVPLCFLVLYAYRTKPYEISNAAQTVTLRARPYQALESDHDEEALVSESQRCYQGGWLGLHAWAAYLNPLGLLLDVISAHRMISKARALQKRQMEQAQKAEQMARYETGYDIPLGA